MLDRFHQNFIRESVVVVCLLIGAVAFNLINLYSFFSVEVSTGTDMVLHTILAEAAAEAISNGQNFTDRWQGSMGMGHPMFHYYQHLPHVAIGLFHVVTFEAFAVADLVRWSAYLLISIFPLSIYWSLRRIGFDQLSSAMGGLVASLIATAGTSGFEYTSYIGSAQGLYTQLWAMVLMPPALAAGYRVLREGQGYFWAVLLLAATLLSHLLYGYMAFITLGVLTFILPMQFKLPWNINSPSGARGGTRAERRRARRSGRSQMSNATLATPPASETPSLIVNLLGRIWRLTLLFLLAGAVTSYFFIPFFLDLSYFNSSVHIDPRNYDSYGHSVLLQVLFEGSMFDFDRFPSLSILVLVGFVICLLRWRNELYLIPLAVFLIWLLLYFGRPTWGSLLNVLPLSQNILMYRFIGGVHLGGILLMAVALGASWRWALSRSNIWYPVAALVLTLTILLPVYIERRSSLQEDALRLEGCQQREFLDNQEVTLLLDELKLLPKGRVYAGRFLYSEPHWGFNYRAGCVLLQARAVTEGLDTMAPLFHRYSLTSDVLDDFDETRLEQYNLFNVRYVVAPEGQIFPNFVKLLRQFGRHRLYEVETTGYFDLVGSELAFAGEKDDFLPAASSWLASGLPQAKLHPVVLIGSTSPEFPTPLSEAPREMATGGSAPGPDRGTVFAEEIGSNYFAAEVTVERESIFLLKASYHPNWRATVDGIESDTLMLMPGFLGIELPPGDHSVRIEYQPRRLRAVLLVMGLLILPLIAIVEARGRYISAWLRPRMFGRFTTR
jgi:hypothetical protein